MWDAAAVVAHLRAKGELWEPAPGLVGLEGGALRLLRCLADRLAELARSEGYAECTLPAGLPLETLARARTFEAFPQWLTTARHLGDDPAALEALARAPDPAAAAAAQGGPAAFALPPALCYHVYERLAGGVVDAARSSVQGTCWRHEEEGTRPLERGRAFTMRELVHVGAPDAVRAFLERGVELATGLAVELGLEHEVVPATDPFYAPTARGRALLQRAKGLKRELTLSVGGGKRVAGASFNDHERFFGECFDIRLPGGELAASGCVAFGLERWVLAYLVAHGPDAAAPEGATSAGGAEPGRTASAGDRPGPLYRRHAVAADRGAWSLERDVRWQDVDAPLARSQPELLAQLRNAALIESFHPVNLARLMRACHDDVDAGVCFSLEAYEGFKHFEALRRYLELVGSEPAITEEELVRIRDGSLERDVPPGRAPEALVEFMLSEHLASYFFRRHAERAREPVLADMLRLIAADEVRHAQAASDLLAKRIARDETLVPRVLDAATTFRHYGGEVVAEVPVAMPGDAVAIRTFAARIERLCGVRLVDHVRKSL